MPEWYAMAQGIPEWYAMAQGMPEWYAMAQGMPEWYAMAQVQSALDVNVSVRPAVILYWNQGAKCNILS